MNNTQNVNFEMMYFLPVSVTWCVWLHYFKLLDDAIIIELLNAMSPWCNEELRR